MARQGRGGIAAALACALVLGAVAVESAGGARYVPPKKKIWHGVSDTGAVRDYRRFNKQVRAHTPLLQDFFHWGVPLSTGALDRWEATDTRGVLSLSTAPGGKPEVITPKQIARGRDDHYLIRLNKPISKAGQVVYIRPFAEMNHYNNPYSAFNANATPRKGHSTKSYKKAWKRMYLIVKGGKRAKINRRLLRMNMPRIHRARSNNDPIYKRKGVPRRLRRAKVAFMWMPLTRSNPNIPANNPRKYWPGRRYVDWVGTDVYSKFSNSTMWNLLRGFYRDYPRFPFALGEYGAWDNDHRGKFTRRIHRWARQKSRVRAIIYFRSVDPHNEFNLQHYPGAKRSLRKILNRGRYQPWAPGTRDSNDGRRGGAGGLSP